MRPQWQARPNSSVHLISSCSMGNASKVRTIKLWLVSIRSLVLFAGQKGCIDDEQCRVKEKNSTCDKGYCICPIDKPLVHGGKCTSDCPEGFANIAGRQEFIRLIIGLWIIADAMIQQPLSSWTLLMSELTVQLEDIVWKLWLKKRGK